MKIVKPVRREIKFYQLRLGKIALAGLICMLFYSDKGFAQAWNEMTYKTDVPGIEQNPMKGWMPGYQGINSTFPYSIDHFYIPLKNVYKDWGECDWTDFENSLDRIVSGGRHVVTRFWIDYPNHPSGMPDFLIDDVGYKVPMYDDNSPHWNDDTLMLAMEEFIRLFGERYDGDPRIAFIEAGLYGFWGEWHTYPENSWAMTQANKDRILIAYKNAFDITHIGLRQSNHASTRDLKMSVGYYDDSFAFNTLCTGSWCSWNGNLVPDAITDNYIYHPFAGELRPEIQSTIFDAWPNGTSNGEEDLETCIKSTHLSFMKAFYLFKNIPTETEFENALRSQKMMGYEFFVSAVRLSADELSNIEVDVKIENRGVAPLYYNWEVEFAAINSKGEFIESIGRQDWDVTTIYPDSGSYTRSFSTPLYGNDTYTILMRFVNSIEHLTNEAFALRFANETQDTDKDGWLTLGTVTVDANDVETTGVSIENCPPDSLKIGSLHQLSAIVEPLNATNQMVYWHSSNPAVATISEIGEVAAISTGTTVITLYSHDSTKTDFCNVDIATPEPILVDRIVNIINPDFVIPGDTITVTVEYEATAARDIRSFIQLNSPPWDTYGSTTVTIAAGAGSVEMDVIVDPSIPTAIDAYKIVVNILPVGGSWPDRLEEIIIPKIDAIIPLNGLNIENCPTEELAVSDSHSLTVTYLPSNASDKSVSWTSSDPAVANVNSQGVVTGVAAGTATITLKSGDGSFSDHCLINIYKPPVPVTGVSLSGCPENEINPGNIMQLNATTIPANADDTTLSWSSSDIEVVIVNENGRIEAVGPGTSEVIVITNDGAYSDNCIVVVVDSTMANSYDDGNTSDILVYPNPVNDKLYLKFDHAGVENTISVFDISGQLLLRESTRESIHLINLEENIPTGFLILKVTDPVRTVLFKIIRK